MAHIVEFSINGLAGRKTEYSATLNRDVNVFFGLNGSGKTSLLKILHSAMADDASILKDVPFSEAKVVIYSQTYNKTFEHIIKKELPSLSKPSKAIHKRSVSITRTGVDDFVNPELLSLLGAASSDTFKWETSPKRRDDSTRWAHSYLPISRLYVGTAYGKQSMSSDRLISEDQLDARFSELLQAIWMRYSYDINSAVRQAQADGLANILQELLIPSNKKNTENKISSDEALERVKSFLSRQGMPVKLDSSQFLERFSNNPEMRNIVNDIDRIENIIEQTMDPINKLNELVHQLMSGQKKIKFSGREIEIETDTGTVISPQLLSSGEKQLLKLLIEVVSSACNSVIIDEPELSMHIDWQKTLLQNMGTLNPECQLIVATHSPEIMSQLEDSKIFRL